jgi:hypothetical protein
MGKQIAAVQISRVGRRLARKPRSNAVAATATPMLTKKI